MSDDEEFKKLLAEIRYNLRSTMQHVQMQFDVFIADML
jgi:hypothetical protein